MTVLVWYNQVFFAVKILRITLQVGVFYQKYKFDKNFVFEMGASTHLVSESIASGGVIRVSPENEARGQILHKFPNLFKRMNVRVNHFKIKSAQGLSARPSCMHFIVNFDSLRQRNQTCLYGGRSILTFNA